MNKTKIILLLPALILTTVLQYNCKIQKNVFADHIRRRDVVNGTEYCNDSLDFFISILGYRKTLEPKKNIFSNYNFPFKKIVSLQPKPLENVFWGKNKNEDRHLLIQVHPSDIDLSSFTKRMTHVSHKNVSNFNYTLDLKGLGNFSKSQVNQISYMSTSPKPQPVNSREVCFCPQIGLVLST
jgi:hypothetical protein